jgi:hypothetical protein
VQELTQGPYVVGTAEPQFSVWGEVIALNGKTEIDRQIYHEISCRTVIGNPSQLVCALKEVLNPCKICDSNIRRCAAAPIEEIQLLEK